MNEHNTYPVFVADQVLTAEHLNQAVNYLDQQGRFTRNRLIGIGIVCGLELKTGVDRIEISKGCGVTSEGYLIQLAHKVCSYWRPYALPEYFSPQYKSVYEKWQMWELLSAEESLVADEPKPLKDAGGFLKDKGVVLLLEMKEKPLKNCVEIDCEDKGERIEFRVRTLLVPKGDLERFLPAPPFGKGSQSGGDLRLRRFQVPARQLSNTDEVFDSFLRLVDEHTLKHVAKTLHECFLRCKPLLNREHNPFEQVYDRFDETLSYIKKANPFFIQYFYDWIDDMVKAYHELEDRVFDLHAVCCPGRELFPLHLKLGEANKDTPNPGKSDYRQYFIHSPLFEGQQALREEVQLLFERLVKLTEAFQVPDLRSLAAAQLKITPSKYLDKPLSDRCIPYYYDPLKLYPIWSWEKTRRGLANRNLSYHAGEYSDYDTVRDPLLYDIEPYNFFRVEGHVGKPVSQALETLLSQREEFNLPFEVVALSTARISAYFNGEDAACHFQDLESAFRVILAELSCKVGEFQCQAGRIPYQTERLVAAGSGAEFTTKTALKETFQVGDFLRSRCGVQQGSVGETYLEAVSKQVYFERTQVFNKKSMAGMAAAPTVNEHALYAPLFYFIHAVERLMETVHRQSLDGVDVTAFELRYRDLMAAAADLAQLGDALNALDPGNDNYQKLLTELHGSGFYALVTRIHGLLHICIDDRLKALKAEYLRRVSQLRILNNLMHYARLHPGLEHKAGVPRGGTFVLVYHESSSRKALEELGRADSYLADSPLADSRLAGSDPAGSTVAEVETKKRALDRLEKELENIRLTDRKRATARGSQAVADARSETQARIREMLLRLAEEEEQIDPLVFQVPEETVIADFYLPYSCCSDCAPVSYVLPQPSRETLSIAIRPTEFCNDDERLYPVTVSPPGGELTASAGGVVRENGFYFSPKESKPGINTLTYALPDGRSTHIDLMISEPLQIDFKTRKLDDLTLQFLPDFPQENKQVIWDFGDGTTSDEFSPTHTYRVNEKEASFVVTLRLTHVACATEVSKTITVQGAADPVFNLKPRVFCSKDRNEYEFQIEPFPKSVDEVVNKDKLVMKFDAAAKKLSFTPATQLIKATRDYYLEYQKTGLNIRVTVPDASFTMQIKWMDVDNQLLLKPKQTDASNYTWTLSQGRLNYSFESRELELMMSELKFRAGADFTIALRVNHQLPSGDCADEKQFVLTAALFKKYQASGKAFDNTTKE